MPNVDNTHRDTWGKHLVGKHGDEWPWKKLQTDCAKDKVFVFIRGDGIRQRSPEHSPQPNQPVTIGLLGPKAGSEENLKRVHEFYRKALEYHTSKCG